MITTSGLIFLSMLNLYSYSWDGWDSASSTFSDSSYTYIVSARATAGQLNTYTFDPFPWSVQVRSQLLKRGSAFGARLDFGFEDPFYGTAAPYLRALYASYRVNIAGVLEARAGWVPFPFQSDHGRPFALRTAGLDYRGLTVMQSGVAWYDLPVDFVPNGGLGAALEHRFSFGLEVGVGYTFLPGAFYGKAAYELKKGKLFIRPEVKAMVFDADDVDLDINDLYISSGAPASVTVSGSGMKLVQAGVTACMGDLLFDAEFGLFSFDAGGFGAAEGLSGRWFRVGGGYLVIKGMDRSFLQALVLRGDLSYRATDRDGEGNLFLGLTASATILKSLEVTAGYAARFPEQENTDPKGYIYLGAGYTMKFQL